MARVCDRAGFDLGKIAGERECLRIRDQPVVATDQQQRRAIEACQVGDDRLRQQGATPRLLAIVTSRATEDLD